MTNHINTSRIATSIDIEGIDSVCAKLNTDALVHRFDKVDVHEYASMKNVCVRVTESNITT